MKKFYPILIVLLIVSLPLLLVCGCSAQVTDEEKSEAAGDLLKTTINLMDETVSNYPEEVANATAETKADIEKEGKDMLASLN